MARYHGNAGAFYMAPDGTGVSVALSGTAEWTLDMSTDRVDVTAFNDANKQSVAGLENIAGTLSGFWDNTKDELYDAMQSVDGTKLYLYPSTSDPTKYWYGPAWVDMSISVGVADAVKFSGTFAANGTWGQK